MALPPHLALHARADLDGHQRAKSRRFAGSVCREFGMRKAEKKDVYQTASALLEKVKINSSAVDAPLLRALEMTPHQSPIIASIASE